LQTFSISQITRNFARLKPNQEKQGESILQFGKGCKLKQDNEKSDKEPYPQPKQSHKKKYRLWEKYLQQRVEKNRENSPRSAQNKRATLPKTKRQSTIALPKRPLRSVDQITNALVATLGER
jgi:hypothetical protein